MDIPNVALQRQQDAANMLLNWQLTGQYSHILLVLFRADQPCADEHFEAYTSKHVSMVWAPAASRRLILAWCSTLLLRVHALKHLQHSGTTTAAALPRPLHLPLGRSQFCTLGVHVS